ncbi:MAG TPA: hypothetical protein VNM14_21300 [Planctomycetota bacterium]|nr:hypothetical protein [Planctomycetota bacterium]
MMIVELPGVGKDKYDQVMKELGFDKKPSWPKGILSHTAGAGPNGWTVVDLWESEADFDAFQKSRLGPAMQRVTGMPQPKITVVPVSFIHPKSAGKRKASAGKKKKKSR